MKNIKKLIQLLSSQEKKRAYLLMVMIILMAFLEMLGVFSIMPFIAVLSNPNLIQSNKILNLLYEKSIIFGVDNEEQFLFVICICVFIVLIVSLSFKALTNYAQMKFTFFCKYSIANRLVKKYLSQPYHWFLDRHSADLGKTILSEVGVIFSKGFSPLLSLISQLFLTVVLLVALILVDPVLTAIVTLAFGLTYGLIYKLSLNLTKQIGEETLQANKQRFKILSEVFSAIKQVKISGLEKIYINRFSGPDKKHAQLSALESILSMLPRFGLEAIAFGGILLVALYLMKKMGDIQNVVPIIALYAFAGYRLMPALQQIYVSLTKLRIVSASLDIIYQDIMSLNNSENENKKLLILNNSIRLNDISFCYPKSSVFILKNINIEITAHTKVGFVGSTGSGKTSLADIILGLLEPQKGSIEIDSKKLTKNNLREWQNSIGYVPQQIYLSDDTIASNIAFGINPDEIDYKLVEQSARIANLHNFISKELPAKYNTTVGERGIRLSGGQIQRIGIARAMYNNPKLLVLDEATSALDNITEREVMKAIYNLKNNITVIIIAHRLTTVKNCDEIFVFNKGKIRAKGSFESLIKNDSYFRESTNN